MSVEITSINYCPVKSISFQSVHNCKIKKNIGIIGDRVFAFAKGLNKDQVRFILGTALVQDPFHKNRWDYVNKVTVGDLEVSNKKLILYFNSDELLDSWIIEDNS